jgi:uncharacterized protein YndB with AHSA1/START domain/predicted enzyme related to lactoylglutathione lyase
MNEAISAQEITVTRVYDAPRELVWKAWTEPEQLARWWGPSGWSTPASGVTLDVRPGGVFRVASVSDEDGTEMTSEAVFREVVEPERLAVEEAAEGAWHEGADTVVTFTDLGDGRTEMVLRATIHTTDEMGSTAEAGLRGSLDRLAELLNAPIALVRGVDFVSLPTRDLDAAMDFYGNVLGLERSSVWQRPGHDAVGAEFETGTVTIALIASERLGVEFQPNKVPIALRVDDVAAARAALESRGVTFNGDTIDSGVCHQAIFEDPDGNALDLHHRYAPRT